MPLISKKGIQMPESPIRKLVPFAEDAKKRGVKVFHLNIGQPDIKTPKIALDAVKNNTLETLAYARSEGSETYRTKLAKYYVKNNIPVTANNIIATTGGSEALLFTIGSITDPGDEIIIPEPFYANYNGFSTASGVTVVPVISKIENNFALPKSGECEKLITSPVIGFKAGGTGKPMLKKLGEIEPFCAAIFKKNLIKGAPSKISNERS